MTDLAAKYDLNISTADQIGRYCKIENICFIQLILAVLPLSAGLVLALVIRKLERKSWTSVSGGASTLISIVTALFGLSALNTNQASLFLVSRIGDYYGHANGFWFIVFQLL